jgi:hypothetical protein
MSRHFLRTSSRLLALLPTLALITVVLEASSREAQAQTPPIFSNYYVPPSPYGGPGAAMYLSPRPTPPLVGHTYITYQPVMPHEFMVPHHRTYYGYNTGSSGWTKTKVCWSYNPFNQVWAKPQQVMPNPRPSGHLARKLGAGRLPVHE